MCRCKFCALYPNAIHWCESFICVSKTLFGVRKTLIGMRQSRFYISELPQMFLNFRKTSHLLTYPFVFPELAIAKSSSSFMAKNWRDLLITTFMS